MCWHVLLHMYWHLFFCKQLMHEERQPKQEKLIFQLVSSPFSWIVIGFSGRKQTINMIWRKHVMYVLSNHLLQENVFQRPTSLKKYYSLRRVYIVSIAQFLQIEKLKKLLWNFKVILRRNFWKFLIFNFWKSSQKYFRSFWHKL